MSKQRHKRTRPLDSIKAAAITVAMRNESWDWWCALARGQVISTAREMKGGRNGCREGGRDRKEVEERKRRVNRMSSIIWEPAVSPPPPGPATALIDPLTRAQNPTDESSIHHSHSSSPAGLVFVTVCSGGVGVGGSCTALNKKANFPCLRLAAMSSFCSERNENSTPHHWILL